MFFCLFFLNGEGQKFICTNLKNTVFSRGELVVSSTLEEFDFGERELRQIRFL